VVQLAGLARLTFGSYSDVSVISMLGRFLGAAGFGALVVAVPISAEHPMELSHTQLWLVALVVTGAGAKGCLWGTRFFDAVRRSLDSLAS
jgi:hypothetical protein